MATEKKIVEQQAFEPKTHKEVTLRMVCESFVFDFMPETLHSVIRSTDMSIMDIKIYTWQMFSGLHYLSCMGIAHRDMKPVNMLVDSALGLLKISDFGSAKFINKRMISDASQISLLYRPPELLLGATHYDWRVDVWSAGCCFGEMLRKKALFSGRDSDHLLRLIMGVIGLPSKADIAAMGVRIKITGEKSPKSGFRKIIKSVSEDALQMIARIRVFNPKERLCGVDFLKSPYFDDLFAPAAKRTNGQAVSTIMSIDDINMADMKEMGYREREVEMNREAPTQCSVKSQGESTPGKNNGILKRSKAIKKPRE